MSEKAGDRDSMITLTHSNSILGVVVYAWPPKSQELQQEDFRFQASAGPKMKKKEERKENIE